MNVLIGFIVVSLVESGASEIDQDAWKVSESKHECADGCCRKVESVQSSKILLKVFDPLLLSDNLMSLVELQTNH